VLTSSLDGSWFAIKPLIQEEALIYNFWRPPYQLERPINRLKRAEVQEVINSRNLKKSSGYDLITGKILKE
jgi:hypothetical protein